MRKNPAMRLFVVLLIATLLSICTLSGTFAKYTSSATGKDTASIAKWSFTVNDQEIALTAGQTENVDFNLFGETDKIAPGMSGSISLKLKNTSEVATVATIDLSETNANNIPIKYSLEETGTYSDINSFDFDDASLAVGEEKTVTIYWKWDSSDDVTDTTIGIAAREASTVPTVEVTATVTASQAS